MILDGDAGPRPVAGRTFASQLGLRSTLFSATVGAATAPTSPRPIPTRSCKRYRRTRPPFAAAANTPPVIDAAAAGSRAAVADVADDLVGSPATWVAGLLLAATAAALAGFGGLAPAGGALLADRRQLPGPRPDPTASHVVRRDPSHPA